MIHLVRPSDVLGIDAVASAFDKVGRNEERFPPPARR
jgi:hypothetical protein